MTKIQKEQWIKQKEEWRKKRAEVENENKALTHIPFSKNIPGVYYDVNYMELSTMGNPGHKG